MHASVSAWFFVVTAVLRFQEVAGVALLVVEVKVVGQKAKSAVVLAIAHSINLQTLREILRLLFLRLIIVCDGYTELRLLPLEEGWPCEQKYEDD
mmetsp:Transcript_29801/g.79227  ORF Transcript_29801/g.79227 Transcript_29801/m.79227 type:complete len:95 (-) Transcript_29801:157-441(-)|eukprot:CAMPEP_0194481364 /NCGR_PEP_ID=MMETSP0253-20130528/3820_1 /TAXON_ID=2966 /ORGANISM="Noctiluca scintillans" /LENGTH=94 /DNA_ID=CAMNT_0039320841 /DNA_START=98 /DNA_END=382 /DNA_ORIENTATION=-